MFQITISWYIGKGKSRIRGTDTFNHHTTLNIHTASTMIDETINEGIMNTLEKIPNFFNVAMENEVFEFGVSYVKCKPVFLNKKSLTALFGSVTKKIERNYQYNRTIYQTQYKDSKITISVYSYDDRKIRDYTLLIEQNDKALLYQDFTEHQELLKSLTKQITVS